MLSSLVSFANKSIHRAGLTRLVVDANNARCSQILKRHLHFTIFIKGLPHTVTQQDLRDTFESYGPIKHGQFTVICFDAHQKRRVV
jgi:RNA recognition motif-containing protein